MIELEASDIQGLIFSGYKHRPYVAFLFVRLEDRRGARDWLRALVKDVTTGEHRPGTHAGPALNVAFSRSGLAALGMSQEALATFSSELQQGMAHPARSRQLGDVGKSDPETWEFGGPNRPVDALVLLHCETEAERASVVAAHRAKLTEHKGITEVAVVESAILSDDKEHFGFRDGISQPAIEGVREPRPEEEQRQVKPGEFVLGYTDEYDRAQLGPTISPVEDPDGVFPLDRDDQTGRKAFGRNGSYLVCRKLYQDVAAFWRFMSEKTARPDGSKDEEAAVKLASKAVGRWPSGASLTQAPERDPEVPMTERPDNNFKYADDDLLGLKCPVTAHVRRCYPRDTLPPGAKVAEILNQRHRLLRRGKPYGPPLADPRGAVDDGVDRGLVFICLQSNLRRQFEFVQQTWLNNQGFDTLYTDRDLTAGMQDGTGTLTIPGEPFRTRYKGVPRVVQTRGGEYFFMPGIKALKWLAGPVDK
jgi:Dyp-type peroxidase family